MPLNMSAQRLAIIIIPIKRSLMIKIADKKTFTEKVLSGTGLQIVRFCAEWSGPCQMMGPIYMEMFGMYKMPASFL